MNTEEVDPSARGSATLADRWIESRAKQMIVAAGRALDTYRFDLLANELYDFVWHEYCDWYLELTKPILWDEGADPAVATGTRRQLVRMLELLVRAAHPVIPYITERLWRRVAPRAGIRGETVMEQPYPDATVLTEDRDAEAAVEWLKAVVVGVRNIRGEMNIKPSQAIPLLLQAGGE